MSVADTGAGIPPEFLPHVFDRFRQADQTTTRAHGGLGLGLSIVKHLVELHGGTVVASSDGDGRGACFSVRLRAEDRGVDMPSPSPASPGPEISLAGRTILVVDDDASTCETVSLLGPAAPLGSSFRAAHRSHLPARSSSTEELIAAIGLES